MTKLRIVEVLSKCCKGEIITVCGWVKRKRTAKGFCFIEINDGSTSKNLQVIAENNLENYEEVEKVSSGFSLEVKGNLVPSVGSKQSVEIKSTKIKILGTVQNPDCYPISAKKHTLEYIREYLHLRPRSSLIASVARIRNAIFQQINSFLCDQGYLYVSTPIVTTLDAEGAGDLFRVTTLDLANVPMDSGKVDYQKDFFGKETYLTVSGQLYLEAYACSLGKVYTFGPTFRAENSNTTRHLAEFWMLEVEAAFTDLTNIMDLAEDLLKNVCQFLLDNCCEDICNLEKLNASNKCDNTITNRINQIINEGFVRIEYKDAINILRNSEESFASEVRFGVDLSTVHERYLAEKYFKRPVIVYNYPKEIKAFYMRKNVDGKTVAAMDVLLPDIGEVIGGSQREERLDVLQDRMKCCNLNLKDYDFYLDLRRYGTVEHSGFGLGFERLVAYLTGLNNVRDVIPFPRASKFASC